MANMTIDEIVEFVDQLSAHEQTQLAIHLLGLVHQRQLTSDERKSLLQASVLNSLVENIPSPRREDWYDDDGR